ncbi:TetR/AcrR family transcriptional regulator [Nonomuraea sediminis]|uniref:TetR/AcrR family transcriptional regulator n=1 Tax=Nonomuraea sediminis TaxID=2835864 RepID=UPI001BDD39A7|nr:TetR/AcrR family transcriptional regulator [Nonomuraea sediminis]
MYSEATKAALLDEATALFAERGYARTALEDVAAASQVTRGAVYHHFASKQALFEAVLDRMEQVVMREIAEKATSSDPWEAAMQALDAFLDKCCDPLYGRLVWLEGPAALGWSRWRTCEEKYAYPMVETMIMALVQAGYVADKALQSLIKFSFWMLGGAGLALAEAPDDERRRIRDEWGYLIRKSISGFQVRPAVPRDRQGRADP